jgi:hypothetical protein
MKAGTGLSKKYSWLIILNFKGLDKKLSDLLDKFQIVHI